MPKSTPSHTALLFAAAAALGLTANAYASYLIWIEAEQPTSTSIPTGGPYAPQSAEQEAALSGGAWVAGKMAPGLFSEYTFMVDQAGRHTLYARRFWQHGAFRWRIDDGPWFTQDQKIQTPINIVKSPAGIPLMWFDLGYTELSAGSHTLRIELIADSAYAYNGAYGFDCFALSDQDFRPQGLSKTVVERIAPQAGSTELGRFLPRTMSLLESATPERRTPVEVLLYGQSIIASSFITTAVREHLVSTFPNARINLVNTAIGGYQAEKLHLTAWQDLYPAYPDLVVFHVYGGEKTGELEEIYRNVRRYTTAEFITWTHHVDNFGNGIDQTREESAATNRMLAKKYGFEIAEVREQWKEHLKLSREARNDFLLDQIHLNPKGAKLLASFVLPHFADSPVASDAWKQRVHTLDLSQPQPDVSYPPGSWEVTTRGLISKGDQPLSITFTGNRVRLAAAAAEGARGGLRVMVDGNPVSTHPGTYAASRSTFAPGSWWPTISRVVLGPNPIEDTYTFSFSNVSPDGTTFIFSVRSEKSGDEGNGTAGQDYVSKSGRIRIKATDLDVAGVKRVTKKDLPPTFETTFKVYCLGRDHWQPPANLRSGMIIEDTIFQELETGSHVLELFPDSKDPVALQNIILHNPLAGSPVPQPEATATQATTNP